ncbi:hypothetical protein LCGC14_2832400, partial [marine sediment metagenome]
MPRGTEKRVVGGKNLIPSSLTQTVQQVTGGAQNRMVEAMRQKGASQRAGLQQAGQNFQQTANLVQEGRQFKAMKEERERNKFLDENFRRDDMVMRKGIADAITSDRRASFEEEKRQFDVGVEEAEKDRILDAYNTTSNQTTQLIGIQGELSLGIQQMKNDANMIDRIMDVQDQKMKTTNEIREPMFRAAEIAEDRYEMEMEADAAQEYYKDIDAGPQKNYYINIIDSGMQGDGAGSTNLGIITNTSLSNLGQMVGDGTIPIGHLMKIQSRLLPAKEKLLRRKIEATKGAKGVEKTIAIYGNPSEAKIRDAIAAERPTVGDKASDFAVFGQVGADRPKER